MAYYNNRNKQQGPSSYNRTYTIASKLRYKADLFHLHKRTIERHFHSSQVCSAILEGDIQRPPMDLNMAVLLLEDDARPQADRPDFPDQSQISPAFWRCTTQGEFNRVRSLLPTTDTGKFPMSDYRISHRDLSSKWRSHKSFHGLRGDLPSLPKDKGDSSNFLPLDTLDQRAYEPHYMALAAYLAGGGEAKSGDEDDEDDQPVHPLQAALTNVQEFNNNLAEWRAGAQTNLGTKHRLQQYVTKAVTSATALAEYKAAAPHIKSLMYQEANNEIFDFLCNYIPHQTQYIIPDSVSRTRDGRALWFILKESRDMHSVNAGAHLFQTISKATQQRGEPYEKFMYRIIHDLGEKYRAASGKEIDRDVQYMVLTENITQFYSPAMRSIATSDALSGDITPLEGPRSISAMMKNYEKANSNAFKNYQSKYKPPKFNRSFKHRPRLNGQKDQANVADGSRPRTPRNDRNRSPRHNSPRGGMTPQNPVFKCRWCKKYRPGKQTNHSSQDCRIKADHLQTVCDICSQKGHPTRFCPQKAHQAHVASSRRASSPRTKPKGESYSRALTAKDARVHLRHLESLSTGQANCKYRIVECKASDSL